jgi:hypothetical protein
MGHMWYLLSWEAQYTINRDNLTWTRLLWLHEFSDRELIVAHCRRSAQGRVHFITTRCWGVWRWARGHGILRHRSRQASTVAVSADGFRLPSRHSTARSTATRALRSRGRGIPVHAGLVVIKVCHGAVPFPKRGLEAEPFRLGLQ